MLNFDKTVIINDEGQFHRLPPSGIYFILDDTQNTENYPHFAELPNDIYRKVQSSSACEASYVKIPNSLYIKVAINHVSNRNMFGLIDDENSDVKFDKTVVDSCLKSLRNYNENSRVENGVTTDITLGDPVKIEVHEVNEDHDDDEDNDETWKNNEDVGEDSDEDTDEYTVVKEKPKVTRKAYKPRKRQLASTACDKCGHFFKSVQALRDHVKAKCTYQILYKFPQNHVSDDKNTTSNPDSVNLSEDKTNHDNILLPDLFKSRKNKRKSITENDNSTVKCHVCDTAFPTRIKLKWHFDADHTTHKIGSLYKCNQCQKTLKSLIVLQKHIVKHHEKLKTYTCDVCKKVFDKVYTFKVHKRVHSGERPYVCGVCGNAFATQGVLMAHTRSVHTKDKPYVCDICGQSFLWLNRLRTHSRKHTGETPYECTQCGKRFTRHSGLRVHKRIHTGERPFECKSCDKTFVQLSALLVHARTHTGERPWNCDICDKNFTSMSSLQSHTRRHHTFERPYVCDVCNKSFIDRCALRTHKHIHSPVKSFICELCGKAFSDAPHLRNHGRSHNDARPFKCDSCDNSFKDQQTLKKHVLRTHSSVKAYKCDICERCFSDTSSLAQHKTRNHRGKKSGETTQTEKNVKMSAVMKKMPKLQNFGNLVHRDESLALNEPHVGLNRTVWDNRPTNPTYENVSHIEMNGPVNYLESQEKTMLSLIRKDAQAPINPQQSKSETIQSLLTNKTRNKNLIGQSSEITPPPEYWPVSVLHNQDINQSMSAITQPNPMQYTTLNTVHMPGGQYFSG